MKAKHMLELKRCKCGSPFQVKAPDGSWYWCLYCDAHTTDCKAKGSPERCKCQLIGP